MGGIRTYRLPAAPADVAASAAADPPAERRSWPRPLAYAAIACTLLIQLVLLLVDSWHRYHSGIVSQDFAIFFQAWHQIGAGHLNPTCTVLGYPYWRSHFELAMWPLALLGTLFPSGVTLLFAQDCALVAAEALGALWVLEAAARRRTVRPFHLIPVAAVLVLFAANQQVFTVAGGDFHFQALACPFLVAAARDLWAGRSGRAWVWVGITLLAGDVAGTYVAGLGISVLVARRGARPTAGALILAGVAWTGFAGLIGANLGSNMAGYAGVVGHALPARGALVVLGIALVAHLGRVVSILGDKWGLLGHATLGGGLLGLAHPWTFGVTLVVLAQNALQDNPIFLSPFQDSPAIIFGTVGTGLVLAAIVPRLSALSPRLRADPSVLLIAVVAASLAVVLGSTVIWRPASDRLPTAPHGVAAQLDAVAGRIPPDAQVIAGFGLVGRFAGRGDISTFIGSTTKVISSRTVVFVFSPTIGNQPLPAEQLAAGTAVQADGAIPLWETADLQAYVWRVPEGVRTVTLP
jgi:hypothetical protein